ncbi:MAG: hypothetical protein MUP09_03895 [Thiovulaceae bacterium]|nr:hypothetical protein [Sulfurimonadaceae bacterium]
MANMSLEEEIKFLREEVERLKKEDAKNSREEFEEDETLDSLVEGAHKIEDELNDKFHAIADRLKEDYENMSPVTAVAIFAVGALFGRIFLSK